MAKDVVKQEKNEVTAFDEELEKQLQADAGKGVSTDTADNLVPLIYVLQPMSPQVMAGPAQIDGAKAGDIWLKNAIDPIVTGKEGIWFMPAVMYMKWTEWIPRDKGGGFVGSYDYQGYNNLPAGAQRDTDERQRPRFWIPSSGNDLIETRYEAGIVWRNGEPLPYVIPFSSTGHTISRGWMTKRTNQRRKDGTIWPAWTHLYKLTTELRKNNLGSWYILSVGDPLFYLPGYNKEHKKGLDIIGGDFRRAYSMGSALAAAFESGTKSEDTHDEMGDEAVATDKPTVGDQIPF